MFEKKIRMDVELSPNFRLSEFTRSTTAAARGFDEQFTVSVDIVNNLYDLVQEVIQPLRYATGRVKINSGYRCARLNRAIHGAHNSQHMLGMAADIVPSHMQLAIDFISRRHFDQMIIYRNFIHVSYRAPLLRQQIIDKRR